MAQKSVAVLDVRSSEVTVFVGERSVNRTFVFKSKNKDAKSLWEEFVSFIGARVATEFLELGLMFLMVDCADLNEYISKFVCQVLVIVANYFLSKLWIFKEKK